MNLPIPPELIEEMLLKNGEMTTKLYGSSMSPLVPEGARVRIRCLNGLKVRVGDILCFHSDHRLIAHRVIEIFSQGGERKFLTKGDGSPQSDPLVTEDRVIGAVVAVEGRAITSPFWRVANFLLAKVSLVEAKLPEWRMKATISKIIHRGKMAMGIRRSFYPFFDKGISGFFNLIRKRLARFDSSVAAERGDKL